MVPGAGTKYPTRTSRAYGLLHAVLESAVDKQVAGVNPARIRGATNVPTKRQSVIPTVKQLAELADAVPERFKALPLLKAWCGLRFGKVTESRRKDFDGDDEVVRVRRSVNHRKDEPGGLRSANGPSSCKVKEVKQGDAHAGAVS